MEIRLTKDESLNAFPSTDVLGGIVDLTILLRFAFEKLIAKQSNWKEYFGSLICCIEEDTVAFYSVPFFAFRWRKGKELLRRNISNLRSCAIGYPDSTIHFSFECGQHISLISQDKPNSLRAFARQIEAKSKNL